ncbi:response regulator transcription factor [Arcobacter sp. YIC-310]|uniref:response regulator transcription factor n=1 Tax=Arcobacter sp. YIC-310 TaxID=3376632 RepID=UPI003C254807
MKILLLEDDLLLNEIIEEHLEEKGHDVDCAYDGNEALELIYSKNYDILLFDVNVPSLNGFELLKHLRDENINTATIFITSANLLEDVEEGFKTGCDDYIKKPFELKELDLRIKNVCRLHNISPNKLLKISEDIKFDVNNLEIIKDNEKIHIRQKESDVLLYLMKRKNVTVSVDELSMNVWAYEDNPSPATIRTYIKNLRKILNEDLISNIRGVGYRFNS